MRRTTIFLSDELHEQLWQDAFRSRVSMAELIRSRLRRKPPVRAADPLAKVEGIVHNGKLSEGIDEALYGG